MRKIMFRGKRTADGEWVEGDLSTECIVGNVYIVQSAAEDNCLHLDLKTGSLIDSDQITIWHEVDPETVSQRVGIEDVHGDDVYENQIVDYYNGKHSFKAVVQWRNVSFYLKLVTSEEILIFNDFFSGGNKVDFRIVGNVFDNPELLEVA